MGIAFYFAQRLSWRSPGDSTDLVTGSKTIGDLDESPLRLLGLIAHAMGRGRPAESKNEPPGVMGQSVDTPGRVRREDLFRFSISERQQFHPPLASRPDRRCRDKRRSRSSRQFPRARAHPVRADRPFLMRLGGYSSGKSESGFHGGSTGHWRLP